MTDSLFKDYFPFELNEDQEKAFLNMAAFLENDDYHIFQLIGYAGTGKTTLVSGFLKYLGEEKEVILNDQIRGNYQFKIQNCRISSS